MLTILQSKSNRDDGCFATSDLFRPHPSTPDAWLLCGRSDDVLLMVGPATTAELHLRSSSSGQRRESQSGSHRSGLEAQQSHSRCCSLRQRSFGSGSFDCTDPRKHHGEGSAIHTARGQYGSADVRAASARASGRIANLRYLSEIQQG